MEYFSAILLFDAFSARKMERFRHWTIVTSLAFLEATLLNFAAITMPNYSKIVIGLVLLFSLHRFLYTSNRMFSFYISVIFYATICCVDNCWYTMLLLMSEAQDSVTPGEMVWQNLFMHSVIIAVCFLQAKARNGKLSQATNFRWYTIPAVLSLASVLLIFFFGNCFQQGQISIQPLCVCATFITVMQIAALLLISWMEQNANFREEAISLQAKSKAQQESIEALSAAYAQQRKLTHDFRAHLSTLDGMLMQQSRDINTIQTYIHSLQSKQTERILLVNTHHAALDALLNQKALVAKNRKIDIQFSVNDLSPIKINMVDLTVIISNTLDNAIEACEKLPETDRQIYVQALLEEDELFYAVRNKSLPVNMITNQLPASTNENPSFHGYGLQNVHTTLEKYHTLYAMDYENGWFEFATELPNTLIS
jgi:two-component system, LytTR family, sensor histidine kinase AgrC